MSVGGALETASDQPLADFLPAGQAHGATPCLFVARIARQFVEQILWLVGDLGVGLGHAPPVCGALTQAGAPSGARWDESVRRRMLELVWLDFERFGDALQG